MSRSVLPFAMRVIRRHVSIALVACVWAASARAQQPMTNSASLSGDYGSRVLSLALTERYLYAGGLFDHAGSPCGSWTSFDLTTGEPLSGGARVTGPVYASIPDGAGGWFLGGALTYANGSPRGGLVHVLADGSVSAWAPSVSGIVLSLALRGDTLYVGGSFSAIDHNVAHPNLAALSVASGAVLPWGSGAGADVQALLLVSDTLFVGGAFRGIHGVARSSLAALDAASGAVLPWSIAFSGSPFANGTPYVSCIAQDGARLYVGGDFNSIGGLATGSFAAIERATASVVPGSYPVGFGILNILVHGGRVYVASGAEHSTPNGPAYGLIALSRTTLQLLPWAAEQPRYKRRCEALAASGDRIFASEGWRDSNSPIDPLFVVDTTSGALRPFADSLRSASGMSTMHVSGGRLWVSGLLQGVHSVRRDGLAEIDLRDGRVTARTLALPVGETPYGLATDGQRVFARTYSDDLLAFDPAVGPDPLWSRPGASLQHILVAQGRLFAIGTVPIGAGPATRTGLLELDPATGNVLPWAPVFAYPASYVDLTAMTADATHLCVSGHFATVDGAPHDGLVAFRLSDLTAEPIAFDPVINVLAMTTTSDRLFVLGSRDGWPQPSLFAYDPTSGAVLPWAPLLGTGGDLTQFQNSALAVAQGDLVVANTLRLSSGPDAGRHELFRVSLTASSWSPYPYEPGGFFDDVGALAARDGVLAVGGNFLSFGPSASTGLAIMTWPSVSVPPSGAPLAGQLAVWPDPVRERLALRFAVAPGERRTVRILDVTGRLERTFEIGGEQSEASWDLRRDDGTRVSPGVHFAQVLSAGRSVARARFVVVR